MFAWQPSERSTGFFQRKNEMQPEKPKEKNPTDTSFTHRKCPRFCGT
jgi:hypothetical protein